MKFKKGEIYYNSDFFSFIVCLGKEKFLSERGVVYNPKYQSIRLAKDSEIKNRISMDVKTAIRAEKLKKVFEELEYI